MQPNLRLIPPTIAYEREYADMLADWEQNDGNNIPWFIEIGPAGFATTVAKLEGFSKGVGLGEGFVANSTFWLSGNDRSIIGVINIRHRLNDSLLRFGGQIGYGVRPGERRKGYGREMLRLGLEAAKGLGLSRVLICCYKDNIASVATILANGGVLDSEAIHEGKTLQRYWVELIN